MRLRPAGLGMGVGIGIGAVLAMLMTACASAPATPPTPTGSMSAPAEATPTPSPTSAPVTSPVSDVTIVVTAERIEILDADGAPIERFGYFQPTAEVVAGLSAYLGAPIATADPGGTESPPATHHDWGGLRLVDTVTAAEPPYTPDHWVSVSAPDALGVPVRAVDGTTVGGPLDAVVGEFDDVDYTDPATGLAARWIRVGIVPLPPMYPFSEGDLNFAVGIRGLVEENRVDLITAPSANFGV